MDKLKIKIYNLNEEEEIFELVGVDNAGDVIYHYQGKPFTGIIQYYKDEILTGEEEFTDGHIGGLQRDYFDNGQIQHEYYKYFGKPDGDWKEWDIDGNLIHHSVWEKGERTKTIIG